MMDKKEEAQLKRLQKKKTKELIKRNKDIREASDDIQKLILEVFK